MVGQIWTKASFSNKNSNGDQIVLHVFKIEADRVWFKTNAIPDNEEEFHELLEQWPKTAKSERYFILHKPGNSIEEKFWGDAAE